MNTTESLAPEPLPSTTTQLHVILVVVYSLALLALAGFIGTFILVREKVDGASIAVFSGLTGTVLGGLMSTLNNTRTATQKPADEPAPTPPRSLPPIQGPNKP